MKQKTENITWVLDILHTSWQFWLLHDYQSWYLMKTKSSTVKTWFYPNESNIKQNSDYHKHNKLFDILYVNKWYVTENVITRKPKSSMKINIFSGLDIILKEWWEKQIVDYHKHKQRQKIK